MAKRINASIPDELYVELARESDEAGVTMSDQMRALLEMWATDSTVREQATARAKDIRVETKRQQYQRKR